MRSAFRLDKNPLPEVPGLDGAWGLMSQGRRNMNLEEQREVLRELRKIWRKLNTGERRGVVNAEQQLRRGGQFGWGLSEVQYQTLRRVLHERSRVQEV